MNRSMKTLASVVVLGVMASLTGCAATEGEEQVAVVGGEDEGTVRSLTQAYSGYYSGTSGSAAPAPTTSTSGSAYPSGSAAPAPTSTSGGGSSGAPPSGGGGSSGGSGFAPPSGGSGATAIAGLTTSAACFVQRLVAYWANTTGYDLNANVVTTKVGGAISASIGFAADLTAVAANGTYTGRRHAKAGVWADSPIANAVRFRGNAALGSLFHCQAGADSSAYVPSGSNLNIPITHVTDINFIPPAENAYKSYKYLNGVIAQYWLGRYDDLTGTWTGANWNWVRPDYTETGTYLAGAVTGHAYNEPNAWVRNGSGTNGTAIRRYGRVLPSGAVQMVVYRPAVVSDGAGRYKAAENGSGLEWNVPVPTTTANAITN